MRGQKKTSSGEQMRRGRTIVAERERAESDSERMQARKKAHKKHNHAVLIVVLMAVILGLSGYMGVRELTKARTEIAQKNEPEYLIEAQIIDEDNRGQISSRMRQYISYLEGDFRDLGYKVKKVTLPTGMLRELYVDLEGVEPFYFKVDLDRGTAETAEDAVRMINYLNERDLKPEYVDVRVEGKAYFK